MRTQNLACGLFELQPKESAADDAAGPSEHGDADTLETLRLPSQQTAAVAAAKRAGRTLVSEVVERDTDVPPVEKKTKKRHCRDEPPQGTGGNAADGDTGASDREPAASIQQKRMGKRKLRGQR